jgi:membrane-associated protease RseP (regulator of RpoE activity)
MVRTLRGRDLLDRIAAIGRPWRLYGNLGVAVAGVVMALSAVFVAFVGYVNLVSPPEPTQVTQPRNFLVIPGVNDFLPLSVAPEILFGLLAAVVVHEMGHGIMCRVGDIGVDSMGGVLLAVLPIGAFVEPDEEEVDAAAPGDRTRMFAAGVMNNFVLTVLAFALLALSMLAIQPIDGVGVQRVVADSPADAAGIQEGDVVQRVDGEPVANGSALYGALRASAPGNATLTLHRDGATEQRTLQLEAPPDGVAIRSVVNGSPAEGVLAEGDRLTAVNGTPTPNASAFRRAMEDRAVGTALDVDYRRNGTALNATVVLGEPPRGEGGFLGVSYAPDGIQVGIAPYDIAGVHRLLGSFHPVDWLVAMMLPLGAAMGGAVPTFFGFEGTVAEFYTVAGPLGALGGLFFVVPTALYWTAWINFNLGIFNCIPALPLDGGHIFREGIRKGIRPAVRPERLERVSDVAAVAVSLLMFGSMALMVLAPRFLG